MISLTTARSVIPEAVTHVAHMLSLPVVHPDICVDSIQVSGKDSADLLLLMHRKEWKEWRNDMETVCESLRRHCEPHLTSFVAIGKYALGLKLNRPALVPQVIQKFKECTIPILNHSEHVDAIISVKTRARSWTDRRVDAYAGTIVHCLNQTTRKKPVLHEITVDPDSTEDKKNLAMKESSKINGNHESLVIIAHYSYAHVFAVATEKHCLNVRSILPVAKVVSEDEPEQMIDWLKNWISTLGYEEDESNNDSGDDHHVDNLLILFQTCVQFALLSRPVDQVLNLNDRHMFRKFIFVQYNISRLNAIIQKFESLGSNDLSIADFRQLNSDSEWKIVMALDELLSLDDDVCYSNDYFCKIIAFLIRLTGEISRFYSSTRVLLERMENTDALIAARVTLITTVRDTVVRLLDLIDVRPVDRM